MGTVQVITFMNYTCTHVRMYQYIIINIHPSPSLKGEKGKVVTFLLSTQKLPHKENFIVLNDTNPRM